MLDAMTFVADWGRFDYLARATGYKAACAVHREAIGAGVALYNHAIGRTKEDREEEAALLAERAKAEAAISGRTRDYAAMLEVVRTWDALLPAIHLFHEAKRLARRRSPAPDAATEGQFDALVHSILVAPGSSERAFHDAARQVGALLAAYEANEAGKPRRERAG